MNGDCLKRLFFHRAGLLMPEGCRFSHTNIIALTLYIYQSFEAKGVRYTH